MPFTDATKNYMLDTLDTNKFTHFACFTDDLATTEVAGGSYARIAVSFDAASSGAMNCTSAPFSVEIPVSTTVKAVGLFDGLTGGTLGWRLDVTDAVFTAAGQYTVSDLDLDLNG
jgi:hypothetical protein